MLGKNKSGKNKNGFRSLESYRTWIEIDKNAVKNNYGIFRGMINPETKLWAVVKSNAYGHGLSVFSQVINKLGIDGFCVDSLLEGLKLRKDGIEKPILVLGPTLYNLFDLAYKEKITLTISNFESLREVTKLKLIPKFHIKIDSGMSRQGFLEEDVPKVINFLKKSSLDFRKSFSGIYTHFASAKDINYPTYTELQFDNFNKILNLFKTAGFKNLEKHVAATGATLINKKYHLDAVRVGIGLYGLWPSRELEVQLSSAINLKPILSWRTLVSEVKNIKQGSFIGYDLVEKTDRPIKIAVLPLGYWHGFSRNLSGIGEILIKGKKCRVLGRVSMDLIVVDVTGADVCVGDYATIIGMDFKNNISAFEISSKSQTSYYEFVTRLNPLIKRVVV